MDDTEQAIYRKQRGVEGLALFAGGRDLERLRKMPAVEITDGMRLIAQTLGAGRTQANRRGGVPDAKRGPQDGLQADQDAMLGELAFAQWRNVWPDISLSPRSGTPDVVISDKTGKSWSVDVKTTRRANGKLLATTKGNADVEIYALAILTNTHVYFPGWTFSKDLRTEACLADFGYGPTYAMPQHALHLWPDT